jgi:hypothetical protein
MIKQAIRFILRFDFFRIPKIGQSSCLAKSKLKGISKNSNPPFSFGEGGGVEVIKGKVF